MFRLSKQEDQMAAHSLQSNPAFHRIIEALSEELDTSISGLMSAEAKTVGQLQGRATLLKEILKSLQYNYN